jgi:hypothetical protein
MTSLDYKTYAKRYIVIYTYDNIIVYTIRTISTFTSLINIFVFMHAKILKSSQSFYYLLFASLADFTYSGLLLISNLVNKECSASSVTCGQTGQLVSLILYLAITEYFSSSLAIFNIMMEIVQTIQRIFVLANKSIFLDRLRMGHVIGVLFIVAFIYYTPVIFVTQIITYKVMLNDTFIYEQEVANTEFGNGFWGKFLPISLSIVRSTLCGPFLFILILLNIKVFRTYLVKKKSFTSSTSSIKGRKSTKSNESLSLMLILISFLYIFGNLPYTIYIFIRTKDPTASYLEFLSWLSRFCLCAGISLKILIYIWFNRLFREQLFYYFEWFLPKKDKLVTSSSRSTASLNKNFK